MKLYRRKSPIFEATQWFKDGDHHMVRATVGGNGECKDTGYEVTPGDWIIHGHGKFYPCSADDFSKHYERVEAE